jgi:glycosyltransferase involved in cell wall biosynthesis
MKKVSIIIATYNRRLALERSLRSVLNQEYANIEVIVIDDGSTDGTQDHIRNSFSDERIRYFRFSKNMGATVARNKGLDDAVGEYTVVWDSDDTLDPAAISTLVKLHDGHPYSCIVSAPTRVFINGIHVQIPTIPEGEIDLETIICKKMPKHKLVRMVHVPTGGTIRYKGKNLDFMVNSELVECGKWIHTQESLGEHYILSDENSLTRKRKIPNIDYSILRAPHLVAYLERFGDRLRASCPCVYAAHAYGASLGLILSGEVSEARRLLLIAMRSYPRLFRCWFVYMLTILPGSSKILKIFFQIRSKMIANRIDICA